MRAGLAATALVVLLMCGCAKPSNVSTALTFKRKSPDTVLVTLKIRNLENRATTPIIPEVSVQTQTDGKWDRPATIIHTAAFVLNRREEHDLTAMVKTKASVIRATVTIKEAETGVMIKNERMERAVPAMAPR